MPEHNMECIWMLYKFSIFSKLLSKTKIIKNYNLYFGIPALLYFINFSIVEVKLLYSLWKNQNHREIFNYNYKKVIKFYLFFCKFYDKL